MRPYSDSLATCAEPEMPGDRTATKHHEVPAYPIAVVERRGISTSAIVQRFDAGETAEAIATDNDLTITSSYSMPDYLASAAG